MPKFLKNIFKFPNTKNISTYAVNAAGNSFLDKNGLTALVEKIATKLNVLDSMYPVGIVIELTNDVDPKAAVGGDWKDVTGDYTNLPVNIKKWQRIIVIDSDKSQLQKTYNQYKDLKEEDYTEESWPQFAAALAKAKEVLDDPSADQEIVNQTNTNLTMAFLLLRKKPN